MLKRFFLVAAMFLLALGGLGPTAGATTFRAAGSAAGAAGSQTLLTISCPSVSVCYAGGDHGTLLATHDGGATWQPQSWQSEYRTDVTSVVSIACPGVGVCFALVQAGCGELGAHVPVLHTTDGGSHWVTTTIQACGSSLACPTVTTCYTIISPTGPGGPAFVQTKNSGGSWQVQARINPNSLQGTLACPTAAVCYVAFQNALGRSTDGGKHWSIIRVTGKPCAPGQNGCPVFHTIACPGQSTCYTAGSELQNGRPVADVISTRDGFRSRASHPIQGLQDITALSCPTQSVCFVFGGLSSPQTGGWVTAGATSRFALTTDGGAHWRVGRITAPYPFNALACPSLSVCYAAGFLGRLMGTRDGGATWHDLTPAIFVSGTYGARQPLHTYSPWFTATQPWQVAVGKLPGPLGANGRPLAGGCRAITTVTVYVRNAQNQIVAGPMQAPRSAIGPVARRTIQATGKLRLDVVAQCSSFSVRVDGVDQAKG